jgi:hypothetical protein
MRAKLSCPSCGGDQIKPIIYGLPDVESFDFEKYEVGGCCVTPMDAKYKCTTCDERW